MRRSWTRAGVIATAVVAACEFQHGALQDVPEDGPPDGPPDASQCTALTDECLGDTWRHCPGPGMMAVDTECGWGCQETQSSITNTHCVVLSPSGNEGNVASGASPTDTLPNSMLLPITLQDGFLVDGDTGKIGTPPTPDFRGSGGTGIVNGIDFQRRGPVSVFRFQSLTIEGTVSLIGTHSIVFIADGEITINGVLDVRGPCTTTIAGPGGGAGGAKEGKPGGGGLAGGQGIDTNNIGGGGGGNGGDGADGGNGAGGNGAAGGKAIADLEVHTLVGGGGGGGGGGGAMTGVGGGGGGAVQLISNTTISIGSNGGINAGGCGGQSGSGGNDGGGGGGAGGTILLEVPKLVIAGVLAVNGGGGGGGAAGNLGRAANGSLDRSVANGSNGSADGGDGAAGNSRPEQGEDEDGKAGGGGGGIGRIRINTRHGSADDYDFTGAVFSPRPGDTNNPTFTVGSAAVAP